VLDETNNSPSTDYAVFSQAGTIIGSIRRNASTAAVQYLTTSDQRLKTDLGLAADLTALRSLRVHDFTWKSDPSRPDRGVFAQEAHDVTPRGITPGSTGDDLSTPWQAEKAAYVPDLIVGWQQHDAEISALQAAITALQAEIAALKAK
jgi:hypothetical protein